MISERSEQGERELVRDFPFPEANEAGWAAPCTGSAEIGPGIMGCDLRPVVQAPTH